MRVLFVHATINYRGRGLPLLFLCNNKYWPGKALGIILGVTPEVIVLSSVGQFLTQTSRRQFWRKHGVPHSISGGTDDDSVVIGSHVNVVRAVVQTLSNVRALFVDADQHLVVLVVHTFSRLRFGMGRSAMLVLVNALAAASALCRQ